MTEVKPLDLNTLSEKIIEISKCAGKEILAVYNDKDGFGIETKSDDSPVTKADIAANKVIVAMLEKLTPEIPVLTEETSLVPFSERQHWPRYWIVDPLDGTKEFINRNDEFTVNIALIEKHSPVMGVVYVPVTDVTYVGVSGHGAHKLQGENKQNISCRTANSNGNGIEVVASKRHLSEETQRFIDAVAHDLGTVSTKSVGSSLKFCLLAEGLADVYPRFAPTSEWDTAAAQAVLCAAGGKVLKRDMNELDYNAKENILNPDFFAVADTKVNWNSVLQQLES
ncbi:MAG: 3'(2'),5'-bisphosphate nucleotidase CysQ [Agarilytica sp.]